jgi:hypothetical protein
LNQPAHTRILDTTRYGAGSRSSASANDIHRFIDENTGAVNPVAFAIEHELATIFVKKHLALDTVGERNGSKTASFCHFAAPGG